MEAEDTLHDAFIAILNSIGKFRNEGSFEGWMKRITIYKAIQKYKSNKTHPVDINEELLTALPSYEAEMATVPLKTLLRCIQELPDRYRLVFNLYQLDGYSHKEVAQLLHISENTSKSNFHRAKLILRKKLAPYLSSQTENNN